MRIWDINPAYLNRQSLLGEHRELHGVVSIIINNKTGYSKHPETIRWMDYSWALKMRHQKLACEMAIRGYTEKSPVILTDSMNKGKWPYLYIDPPFQQFNLLKEKYTNKTYGRIALPKNYQQLWNQHKYSVMARNQEIYKELGHAVAKGTIKPNDLADLLVHVLREKPSETGIRTVLQRMWRCLLDFAMDTSIDLSDLSALSDLSVALNTWPLQDILLKIQQLAMAHNIEALVNTTALSELMAWLSLEKSSIQVIKT
ncbi:hypothetical protein TI05_06635 [Achromatium sp. WMS3]|nr:hypothetical protein TI05_06635 [Achromatium sp. WMS3]